MDPASLTIPPNIFQSIALFPVSLRSRVRSRVRSRGAFPGTVLLVPPYTFMACIVPGDGPFGDC